MPTFLDYRDPNREQVIDWFSFRPGIGESTRKEEVSLIEWEAKDAVPSGGNMRELSAAAQDEIRRQERNHFEKLYGPRTWRQFTEQAEQSCRRIKLARQAKVPGVGIFFVVNGKPWVAWTPWTEIPSYAGFRTYGGNHPDYWRTLRKAGKVLGDISYDETTRGRVNYEEAGGWFTLFTDRCVIKKKRLVSKIMKEMNLGPNTRVKADDHYQCLGCMPRRPPCLALDEEWDF
jgi:hypothetical protein